MRVCKRIGLGGISRIFLICTPRQLLRGWSN